LKADKDELLRLGLTDQVIVVIEDEKGLANKVLGIAKENIKT
jgi:hypothetical protein